MRREDHTFKVWLESNQVFKVLFVVLEVHDGPLNEFLLDVGSYYFYFVLLWAHLANL